MDNGLADGIGPELEPTGISPGVSFLFSDPVKTVSALTFIPGTTISIPCFMRDSISAIRSPT